VCIKKFLVDTSCGWLMKYDNFLSCWTPGFLLSLAWDCKRIAIHSWPRQLSFPRQHIFLSPSPHWFHPPPKISDSSYKIISQTPGPCCECVHVHAVNITPGASLISSSHSTLASRLTSSMSRLAANKQPTISDLHGPKNMARVLHFPDKLSLVLIRVSLFLRVSYSPILTIFSIHRHRSHAMARRQTCTRNWCRNSRPSIPLTCSIPSAHLYENRALYIDLHIYKVAFGGSNINGLM